MERQEFSQPLEESRQNPFDQLQDLLERKGKVVVEELPGTGGIRIEILRYTFTAKSLSWLGRLANPQGVEVCISQRKQESTHVSYRDIFINLENKDELRRRLDPLKVDIKLITPHLSSREVRAEASNLVIPMEFFNISQEKWEISSSDPEFYFTTLKEEVKKIVGRILEETKNENSEIGDPPNPSRAMV